MDTQTSVGLYGLNLSFGGGISFNAPEFTSARNLGKYMSITVITETNQQYLWKILILQLTASRILKHPSRCPIVTSPNAGHNGRSQVWTLQ
jgi:hypothetical protein